MDTNNCAKTIKAQFLRIINNKRIQLHTFKSRPHRGINTRHELIP